MLSDKILAGNVYIHTIMYFLYKYVLNQSVMTIDIENKNKKK